MKNNNTLLYVLLGISALIIGRKINLFNKIQFSPAGISINKNPFGLNIKMQVNNPTGASAKISNITGSIFQNGAFVANVTSNTVNQIQPYNRTLISLSVKPDLLGALQAVTNYKLGFDFSGSAVVDGVPLPINFNYTF
jgi:hypothetical protein